MLGVTVPGRYAIIPTRNRPTELAAIVGELHRQGATVVVVDNASDPPVDSYLTPDTQLVVLHDSEQPPNLSRLWNVGLDHVAKLATDTGLQQWDVAVLNDDAVIPAGWFDACTAALRSGSAMVACSAPHGTIHTPLLKTVPDQALMTRMCPHAFVTRGEAGMRSDESMRWWWFDSDWDFRARLSGGVQLIPGYPTVNACANSSTVGVLAEQAGRDRARFAEIWGHNPW